MRIFVLHDIFRSAAFGIDSCALNARWIEALLKKAVAEFPVTVVRFSGRSDGGEIDELAVAQALDLSGTPEGWAALTNARDLELLSEFEPLFQADLIVGFGLTAALINAFDKRGIPIVDVEISPLRFGPSLPFRVRTSHPGLLALLHQIVADEVVLESAAQGLMGRSAAQNLFEYPGSWGMFCGQTHLDLALVADGKLVSPEHDEPFERIKALAQTVDIFHIAPHPFTAGQPTQLRRLFAEIPNAIPAERATYAYLASGRLDFICSLSSSVLLEAPWFGVPSKRIITPDRDRVEALPFNLSRWMDVDGRIFSRALWSALLAKQSKPLLDRPYVNSADVRFMGNLGGSANDIAFAGIPKILSKLPNRVGLNVSSGDMLRAGWHPAELWGCWSSSEFSSLLFLVDDTGPVDVVLECSAFMDVEVQYRALGEVGFMPLRFNGPLESRTATVRVTPGLGGICGIIFRIPVLMSPSIFDSIDSRRLGLAVRTISVRPVDTDFCDEGIGLPDKKQSSVICRPQKVLSEHRRNDWLLPYSDMVRRISPRILIECGGMGDFLGSVSDRVETLIELDALAASMFPFSARGIHFQRWNAMEDSMPSADMICSAGFLERVPMEATDEVLARMVVVGSKHLHVIGCRKEADAPGELETASGWLKRFQALDTSFFILEENERSDGRRTVTLVNFRPDPASYRG